MTLSADEITAAGLHFDINDAVATVTLSRPEVRNAQTPAMWHALAAIGEQLPGDDAGRGGQGSRAELQRGARPGDARPGDG